VIAISGPPTPALWGRAAAPRLEGIRGIVLRFVKAAPRALVLIATKPPKPFVEITRNIGRPRARLINSTNSVQHMCPIGPAGLPSRPSTSRRRSSSVGKSNPTSYKLKKIGGEAQKKFLDAIPGMKKLKAAAKEGVDDFQAVLALDGRIIRVSERSALNFRIQPAGVAPRPAVARRFWAAV
jgi:hypothetical protein